MKTKEISVNVSKKIGQPNFSSAMISASITTTVEEETEVHQAFLEAWAKCWEEIEKQQDEIKEKERLDKDVNEAVGFEADMEKENATQDPIMDATAPMCPIHKLELVWHPAGVSKRTNKPYAGFYGCPGRNPDGSFCKYKPK